MVHFFVPFLLLQLQFYFFSYGLPNLEFGISDLISIDFPIST